MKESMLAHVATGAPCLFVADNNRLPCFLFEDFASMGRPICYDTNQYFSQVMVVYKMPVTIGKGLPAVTSTT